MVKTPQIMINVPRTKRVDLDEDAGVQKAVQSVEAQLAGRGRVLLRPSGTEPVVRVMVEGEDEVLVTHLAQQLAVAVQTALN